MKTTLKGWSVQGQNYGAEVRQLAAEDDAISPPKQMQLAAEVHAILQGP